MTLQPSDLTRPRAFCATCDGLGLVSSPVLEYPVPCAVCDGSGSVERTVAACYTCGLTGREWIVGIGFIRCRACYPPQPGEFLLAEAPPPRDWIVLTIVLGCIAVAAAIAGACTWSALCRGWIA